MTSHVGSNGTTALAAPFALTDRIQLRNRLVATAHGRAAVTDGVPSQADADYWERLASGGVAMCIAGATVTSATSTYRARNLTEAWSPRSLDGLRLRAEAMHRGGAAAILQLVHLGRETLGVETYYAPVAPSAVRSPREPTRPRELTDAEVDDVIEGFRISAFHAAEAGFDGIELHAAHGYLLAQFLSATTNRRPGAESAKGRAELVRRIAASIREAAPTAALGIRLSIGDADDAGLTADDAGEALACLDDVIDYVNLTVGMRADYVRDMATERPPLLDDVPRLRQAVGKPLLISHGFRDVLAMEAALESGADMVGMARALIADPDLPRKLFEHRVSEIRPCVACTEDCRSFAPTLLCTVNPDLAAPGDQHRRAAPLIRGRLRSSPSRVAIVGAGPGGLEVALSLQNGGSCEVVVYEAGDRAGGAIALASQAPHRGGWKSLIEYYERNIDAGRTRLCLGTTASPELLVDFDGVIIASGAEETLREDIADSPARTVSAAIAAGAGELADVQHLVVVDDGFGWWPAANAIELGIAGGVRKITVVTPGTAFATALPGEGRVGFLKRIRGRVPIEMKPLTVVTAIEPDGVRLAPVALNQEEWLAADAVIVAGERQPRSWSEFEHSLPGVIVIGDAVVPRRVAHTIAEGRAAAAAILSGNVGQGEQEAVAAT
jgi:2,4-dienoyl-CoA reductase-like NADH-dependent reductase (Old Yellow Enzyme family)